MKLTPVIRVTLLASALVASLSSARADITIDDGNYNAASIFTSVDSNSILSFDYASTGTLYYMTSTPSFNFGGFYSSATGTIVAGSSAYSGASVVAIGDSVYFNNTDSTTFDSNIYKYSLSGTSVSFVSNTTNYGLYKGSNGSLYLTGSVGFGTNHIYNTALNPNGTFVSDPAIDLGADSGSSGPLAFDSTGNLYYTAGSGDMTIYKWSAADVANALANPGTMPLTIAEAQAWATYTSGGVGGTSMLIYNNQLLLTLTNFGSPPTNLVSFGINPDGTYNGTLDTILTDTSSSSSLGELRSNNGNLYLSDGNQIYQIQSVPEPSTFVLMLAGALGLVLFRSRRIRHLASVVASVTALFFFR